MKTTFDLPEALVRKMKMKAVKEGRKLKDVATELLTRGLEQPEKLLRSPARHRVQLPLIEANPRLPAFNLTGQQIHELETRLDIENHESSLRH